MTDTKPYCTHPKQPHPWNESQGLPCAWPNCGIALAPECRDQLRIAVLTPRFTMWPSEIDTKPHFKTAVFAREKLYNDTTGHISYRWSLESLG